MVFGIPQDQNLEKMAMQSLFLLSALLFIPILFLIIRRVTNSRNSQHLCLPPSPPKLPLLGNLHQLGLLPHQSLQALSNKHGPLMLLQLGQVRTIVVSSASAAKEVMKTHDHIFASRPSLKAARIILRGGRDIIFSPYGEYWRQIRNLCVNHLLNAKMVQTLRPVLEQEVASMISDISQQMSISPAGHHGINISNVLNLFVNKYLCRILFGDRFRDEARSRDICKLIEADSVIVGQFVVGDFVPALGWLDSLSGFSSRATQLSKKWEALFEEIIEDHTNRHTDEKLDFVDVLLAVQKDNDMEFPVTKEMIKAILMDMIGAGTDSTFLVLDWGMAELIRNSEAMMKLKNEIRTVAVSPQSAITVEELSTMTYLKATIKESLRLHPPAPLLIPRESMDHCSVQGYDIPKQTRVLINAWAISRDVEYWESPDEFRPERFLNCSTDYKGHDFEFIPFGAGRRICPGMQFATSTLELAFASLINSFEWELPAGIKREDLDMAESPGITTRRRQRLYLVAKPLKPFP